MFDLKKHFEKLMNTYCEIYRKEVSQNTDGTVLNNFVKKQQARCLYHSDNKRLVTESDRENLTGNYIFCLPLGTDIEINDYISVNGKYYKVIKRREPPKFEIICEAVYEPA